MECGEIRKDFGNVECQTGKWKRELKEWEELKSAELGLTEATGMRAGLSEVKLSMCLWVGAGK